MKLSRIVNYSALVQNYFQENGLHQQELRFQAWLNLRLFLFKVLFSRDNQMLLAVSNVFNQRSFTLKLTLSHNILFVFSLFFFFLFLFVAYCLLEAISHNVMSVPNSPLTNSTDFDLIFPDLTPFLFRNIVGCSAFVEDNFEWPRMLLGTST